MNYIKKTLLAVIVALAVFALPCYGVGAEIRDIKINAVLLPDGSANITETWDVTVTDGTEYYLAHSNMGDMTVSNLSVSDETDTVFENIGAWDISRNMEQKAKKCGIVESSDGYELCWGIGSFGDHVFTVSYNVSGVVMEYTDNLDGFNYRFVNDELSSPPLNVMLTIEREGGTFTTDDTGIWAFGFRGNIEIVDGKIVAKSSEKFRNDSNMTVLARFEPNMFDSNNVQNITFASVKDRALVGSDYDPNPPPVNDPNHRPETGYYDNGPDTGIKMLFASLGALFVATIAWAIAASVKHSARIKKMNEEVNYFRDVPVDGDLLVANYLSEKYNLSVEKNAVIGAQLLRWVYGGTIEIIQTEEDKFFGGTKETTALKLCGKPANCGKMEELYDILVQAARDDGILQEREMEKWCSRNARTYSGFVDSLADAGFSKLYENGGMTKEPPREARAGFYKEVFTDAVCAVKNGGMVLSVKGMQGVAELMGLKKYLKDFTLINERQPKEVELWNDYLVFASLFGIADAVEKSFKSIYPEYFEMPENNYNGAMVLYTLNSFNRAAYRSAQQAQQASRSSGMGGSSSFGGGGGFSGGGSGGGSR